jgi:hypothetical protein
MVDERSEEEKSFDRLLKRSMMSLGKATPSKKAAEPKSFDYVMYWNRAGRKDQPCRIVKAAFGFMTVEFEDGFRTIVDKRAIRRRPMDSMKSGQQQPGQPRPSHDQDDKEKTEREKTQQQQTDDPSKKQPGQVH